jgi:hypothetical protein
MTLRLNGSTSGYTEIDAPAVAGSNTLVLPTGAGSAYQVVRNGATAGSLEFTDKIVSGTAVASTSGTSIDFTGIPSWVKRVTVMFNGVSTNGTSAPQIQLGAGSVTTSGYNGNVTNFSAANAVTSGHPIHPATGSAGLVYIGQVTFTRFDNSNSWVGTGLTYTGAAPGAHSIHSSAVTLSGTLDRVRITTTNGTDTFDAGSINIMYE